MRAQSCLGVFLLTVALLQPCFAEVCDDGACASQDSPEELVALQKPLHKKAAAKPKKPRKTAKSLMSVESERLGSVDSDHYEGTSESAYENIVAKQGTSLMHEEAQCTIPKSLDYRFKASKTFGYASKGSQSLMQMLDKPPFRKPFTYIRYGDAEWTCALGDHSAAGTSKEKMRAEICDKLLEDLQDFGSTPSSSNKDAWNLFVGVGAGYLCEENDSALHKDVGDFLKPKERNVKKKFNGWMDSFYLPLIPSKETAGEFRDRPAPFFDGRKVVTVGPTHFVDLESITGRVEHIPMHRDPLESKMTTRAFWAKQKQVYDQMLSISHKHRDDNVIFLVEGGLPAKLLMYKAYRTLGHKDTIIDVGASLDIFTGKGGYDWNQDTVKICRDYPEYVQGRVCMEAASNHIRREAKAAAKAKAAVETEEASLLGVETTTLVLR